MYQDKDRQTDQWHRTGSPEINPCISSQMIFDKGAKDTQQGKDCLFNKRVPGKLVVHMQRMKLDSYSTDKNQLKME